MDNRRLVILVEGESELMFINQQVIPELYKRTKVAWSIEACKVITNRQLNKKGGSINYEYLPFGYIFEFDKYEKQNWSNILLV